MNDITALAQREKFEAWAEEVGALPWGRLKKQRNTSGGYSLQVYTYMWKAWQAANAELVEALEKREELRASANRVVNQQDIELQELRQRIAELEESHAQVIQSLDHYKRMSTEGLQQLAESRTVTVKLPPRVDSSNVPFTAHTWNCCLDAVEKCLAAAGIQVIEGEGQ